MKILQNGITLEEWETEVECTKAQGGCGARLSVKADDIVAVEQWCMGEYLWSEVGTRCPNCNKVLIIDNELIPDFIKKSGTIRRKKS